MHIAICLRSKMNMPGQWPTRFVAVFAFVLFRDIQFSRSVVIGGLLVFAGVATIIWNNP